MAIGQMLSATSFQIRFCRGREELDTISRDVQLDIGLAGGLAVEEMSRDAYRQNQRAGLEQLGAGVA